MSKPAWKFSEVVKGFKQVVNYAKRRGVSVKVVPQAEFDSLFSDPSVLSDFHEAPFESCYIGINTKERSVIVSEDYLSTHPADVVPAIIHELGHLLFGEYPQGDETEFFGFEYLLARRLRIVKPWKHWQRYYGLTTDYGYEDFGRVKNQAAVLRRYALEFLDSGYAI